MPDISTHAGESLVEKHARIEREVLASGKDLTAAEQEFIDAEEDLDAARQAWEASDKRTTKSAALRARVERARSRYDTATAQLHGPRR